MTNPHDASPDEPEPRASAPAGPDPSQSHPASSPPEFFAGTYDPHLGFGPAPEDPRRTGALVSAVIIGVVVAAVGLLIGVLWALVAPRVGVIEVAQGFVYADAEPEEAVAADAWFTFLGLGAGLVFTVLAWTVLRRFRGVAMLVGLVLGSLVGAWLTWWLGLKIGMDQFQAVRNTVAAGTRVDAPLILRLTDLDRHTLWPPKVTGVLAAQALAAAITYTVLAGFSIHPGLRPPPKSTQAPTEANAASGENLSSDLDAPAGPTG